MIVEGIFMPEAKIVSIFACQNTIQTRPGFSNPDLCRRKVCVAKKQDVQTNMTVPYALTARTAGSRVQPYGELSSNLHLKKKARACVARVQ